MFFKNDNSFTCINCGAKVDKLHYTSRDHCNKCLCSVHVDITPGDRLNDCLGLLLPINVVDTAKKGKVIIYKCSKCGAEVKNIVANDDDINTIYDIIKKYSKGDFK